MTTACSSVSVFLSAPTPTPPPPANKHPLIFNKQQLTHFSKLQLLSVSQLRSHSVKLVPPICFASTSSTPAVEEDDPEIGNASPRPFSDAESPPLEQDSGSLSSVRGCKACGREEIEAGCNGEGRMQGGIATVPGFGWWPIKAYRPCPAYLATGGRYKRRGQSMDEVTSGRIGRAVSSPDDDDDKPK